MSLKKWNPRTIVLLVFITVVALLRVFFTAEASMSPLATFTPIGAMALFGGAYFNSNIKALLFPLLTLWISDIFLNRFVYYGEWVFFFEGFVFTYGAFALIALSGKWLIRKVTVSNIVLASFVAVLIHWIGTSPGCFLVPEPMYPQTWGGYFTSLVAAIPYERNFLIGTLLYSGVLFGGFEWLQHRYKSLQFHTLAS
ncbi:MAG: hypothetical protein P0Y53_03015 [Candidatus Pseudobacter hemicellulosilyticus]|uniref:Uncharacterized protein n=1 Tax=Candidatus Pseudobacter hemicellulosilyticus TaxID=3121375 RepID=A0AAJ5WTG8_9BACT|nr:MAG: hypothetical protein P0Y53_03015 [Pseudobacter sp.]